MPTPALLEKYAADLRRDEPLAKYTAARLGGPADWLYLARGSLEALIEVVSAAWDAGLPVTLLGGGANVLIADRGIRGLVVVNKVSEIQFGDWYGGINLSATGGASLTVLAHKCQVAGLSGLEWAVNVPGTVGGAVVNNAGAHGRDLAADVAEVVILEPSGVKLYRQADLQFAYRESALKKRVDRRFVVLLATFVLRRDDPLAIKARMDEYMAHRKRTQPSGASLGSIFKNPPGDYAGRLIEAAGLKGYQIGSAMVSPVHANFFINRPEVGQPVRAADYAALVRHVQQVVVQTAGVHLETEIELLGEWESVTINVSDANERMS